MSNWKFLKWFLILFIGMMSVQTISVHADKHEITPVTMHRIDNYNQSHHRTQLYLRIKKDNPSGRDVSFWAYRYFNNEVNDPRGLLIYITKHPQEYQFVMGRNFANDLKDNPLMTPRLNDLINHGHYNQFIQSLIHHLNSQFPPIPQHKQSAVHAHTSHKTSSSPKDTPLNQPRPAKPSLNARKSMMKAVFIISLVFFSLIFILFFMIRRHMKIKNEINRLKMINKRQTERLSHQHHGFSDNPHEEKRPVITLRGRK